MQANLGSAYVNDFNLFGRTWKVYVQADEPYRIRRDDITQLEVRSPSGKMVPLSTLVEVSDTVGPTVLKRHNLYAAATVTGDAAPDSARARRWRPSPRPRAERPAAVDGLRVVRRDLPGAAGRGGRRRHLRAGAGLRLPVPRRAVRELDAAAERDVLGAASPFSARRGDDDSLGLDNNVYTQIGLVLLVGLSAKTAILIVEFANQQREEGKSPFESAGARWAPRCSAGCCSRPWPGVFFIPFLYYVVQRMSSKRSGARRLSSPAGPRGGLDANRRIIVVARLARRWSPWHAITACTVGPDYKQPEISVPDVWQSRAVEGVDRRSGLGPDLVGLRSDDPVLVDLLKRAEAANLDLEVAVARIREARALHRIAKGEWSPEINAKGNAGAQQFSENSFGDPIGPVGGPDHRAIQRLGVGLARGRSTSSAASAARWSRRPPPSRPPSRTTATCWWSCWPRSAVNYVDAVTLQERIELAIENVRTSERLPAADQDRFNAGSDLGPRRGAGRIEPGQHRGPDPAARGAAQRRVSTASPCCSARTPAACTTSCWARARHPPHARRGRRGHPGERRAAAARHPPRRAGAGVADGAHRRRHRRPVSEVLAHRFPGTGPRADLGDLIGRRFGGVERGPAVLSATCSTADAGAAKSRSRRRAPTSWCRSTS